MSEDVARIARPLRVAWLAVCGGAVLAIGLLGWLAVQVRQPALAEHAEGAFYTVALLSVVATVGAFSLVRRMEDRLGRARTVGQSEALLKTYGAAALAAAEVPALAGATAALLTGDLLPLAFGVPLFAFAGLLWPSDDRVARWLRPRD